MSEASKIDDVDDLVKAVDAAFEKGYDVGYAAGYSAGYANGRAFAMLNKPRVPTSNDLRAAYPPATAGGLVEVSRETSGTSATEAKT